MSYTIYHFINSLTELTGHEQGDELTEEQVITLMREAKVNLLIHHVQKTKQYEAKDYVYVDDLKHRFQQR